jgi:hypothetical protein
VTLDRLSNMATSLHAPGVTRNNSLKTAAPLTSPLDAGRDESPRICCRGSRHFCREISVFLPRPRRGVSAEIGTTPSPLAISSPFSRAELVRSH